VTIKNWYGADSEEELATRLDSVVNKARWISHLATYIHELDPIQDFTRMNSQAQNDEIREDPKHMSVLRLDYAGAARTAENGVRELAEIMLCTKCLFDDLQPAYIGGMLIPENHGYGGLYEGEGMFGGIKVMIRLFVPWTPTTCELVAEPNTYVPEPVNWVVKCPTRTIEA
jgi:hypothetical protein